MQKLLRIDSRDNVAVALTDLKEGDTIKIDSISFAVIKDIPRAHKVALRAISKNENIMKYGFPIGHAIDDIPQGGHVDASNLKTNLEGVLEYLYTPHFSKNTFKNRNLSFKGYKRKNGSVGIRNELWIVPTVGCVNGIGEQMLKSLSMEVDTAKLDGVEVFKHNYGCSQLGDDHENTRAGYVL